MWYSAGCSSQTDKFHLCIKVNTMNHTKEEKPAPTIAWNISDGVTLSNQQQTVTVKNSDHKFNTSSNITLKVSPDWSGHSDCVLNFWTMGERKEMMRLPDEKEKKGGGRRERYAWVILWYCVYVWHCILACQTVSGKWTCTDSSSCSWSLQLKFQETVSKLCLPTES